MATSMRGAARLVGKPVTIAAPLKTSCRGFASRSSPSTLAKTTVQASRTAGRRTYASGPSSTSSSTGLYIGIALAVAGGAGGYFYLNPAATKSALGSVSKDNTAQKKDASTSPAPSDKSYTAKQEEYQAVYNEIANRLVEHDDYDDGSYGPVLVRLAWHCSGTYDAASGTGGSNGATMRFAPEGDHGANAGLKAARDFLEPVKKKFPWITYSDLWTLAGVTAIQEMAGPQIPWRPGRSDRTMAFCTPDGRLPDGAKGSDHLRAIFTRMGFDDREIVALSGAHALGRCHTDRSGFEGPWSFSPTIVSNDYFRLLLSEDWKQRKWNGPKQFQDQGSKSLMMLPTDMALIQDPVFVKHVKRYATDSSVFFAEFRDVIVKLFELGVPFDDRVESAGGRDRMLFKPTTSED